MTDIGQRIHEYIDVDAPRLPADHSASSLLTKYYAGRYTGAWFDSPELQSPDPDRFTARDMTALATLSVPLSGQAVVGLLKRGDDLAALLKDVPTDVDLADASDEQLTPLFRVQDALDTIPMIGHVTRSKLLAHKRPRLVPIRDQYVLTALLGQDSGEFTTPLRDALKHEPKIVERLQAVKAEATGVPDISVLRTLDVIVWMATHGNAPEPDDETS